MTATTYLALAEEKRQRAQETLSLVQRLKLLELSRRYERLAAQLLPTEATRTAE